MKSRSGVEERRQAARAMPSFGRRVGERLHFLRCGSDGDPLLEFARGVALGLADRPRRLPSRFLYDAEGSRLFERISATPEYYLTRTEARLLADTAAELSTLTGDRTLVELGAGNARKTEILLAAYGERYDSVRYVPIDVSGAALAAVTDALAAKYPRLSLFGLHGPYEAALPFLERFAPLVLLFLGSSVGNLDQVETAAFWQRAHQALVPGDFVLLGVDLVKDPAVIHAAYNDAAGWSAAFTRNVFARMNRELGSAIDLGTIAHEAAYRPDWQRVEIAARFTRRQEILLAPLGETGIIEAGERVVTEISRKFETAALQRYLHLFGFETVRVFTDRDGWYALLLLRREAGLS
jgi:L-histidine N-alpha-methyltransferase